MQLVLGAQTRTHAANEMHRNLRSLNTQVPGKTVAACLEVIFCARDGVRLVLCGKPAVTVFSVRQCDVCSVRRTA